MPRRSTGRVSRIAPSLSRSFTIDQELQRPDNRHPENTPDRRNSTINVDSDGSDRRTSGRTPMTVFDIFNQYGAALCAGLLETLRLAAFVWGAGLVIGIALGVLASRYRRLFGWPVAAVAFVLSGIPILVVLFWLHYPLQAILNVVIDPFVTAAITLSVINVFTVSELVRRVLRDFPSQYLVAAQVCGIGKMKTITHIQFPLVLRQVLPGLLMTQVAILQATLFASLISVDEIFRTAQQINASIYRPVEIYTSLGVLFLSVCLPLNGVALWLRNQYTRDLSEH